MAISHWFSRAVLIRRFQTSCAFRIALCSRSSPLPVRAETVTSGAPLSCGSSRSKASRSSFSFCGLSSSRSHLFAATTTARPSVSAKSAMRRSCCSKGMATSSRTTTTSAKRTARNPSATESLSTLSVIRAFFRIPAVSKMRTGVPMKSDLTEIESRVIPASGPVSSRSSPMILLISVDLPAFGRPITAICSGRAALGRQSSAPSPDSACSSVRVTSVSGAMGAGRSASTISDRGFRTR